MTTVQIVGIAVASAVLLLLIIALIVTRRRGAKDESKAEAPEPQPAAPDGGSFLDAPVQDTLSGLGKAEQPVDDVTVDPALERAHGGPPPRPADLREPPSKPAGGLGLDWGPTGDDASPAAAAAAVAPAPPLTAAPAPALAPVPAEPETTTGEIPAVSPPPTEAAAASAAGETPAPPPAPQVPESAGEEAGQLVPLSDIIVTTSSKMVDLRDPEVRRMLANLVKFEIDQATQYRELGQTIDAVLQLTEAEKISRALGMEEAAEHIRTMMRDLQA